MGGLQIVSVLLIIVGLIGFAVAGVFWLMPSRRSRAKWVQALAVAALVIGFVGFNTTGRWQAEAAGFRSVEDQREARKAGIEDGAAWYQALADKAAQEKAEARTACRADLQCWGREARINAEVRCRKAIERKAGVKLEWTDSWSEPMFSRFSWADEAKEIMTYYGDRLRRQAAGGVWEPVTYSCDYDIANDQAVDVVALTGHL